MSRFAVDLGGALPRSMAPRGLALRAGSGLAVRRDGGRRELVGLSRKGHIDRHGSPRRIRLRNKKGQVDPRPDRTSVNRRSTESSPAEALVSDASFLQCFSSSMLPEAERKTYRTPEEVLFGLTYTTLMLNTDLHNKQVGSKMWDMKKFVGAGKDCRAPSKIGGGSRGSHNTLRMVGSDRVVKQESISRIQLRSAERPTSEVFVSPPPRPKTYVQSSGLDTKSFLSVFALGSPRESRADAADLVQICPDPARSAPAPELSPEQNIGVSSTSEPSAPT